MAGPETRLAIDLSGGLIRVVDGVMGGSMWTGSAVSPDGAIDHGKVLKPDAVGATLKQLLARNEIAATRALVAASDAVASFRVLRLAATADDAQVDATIARELPRDPEKLDTRWADIGPSDGSRDVFAAVWDRALVANVAEAAKQAGIEPVVIELKSTAVARAITEPACVVVDMSSDPIEFILFDDYVPRLWYSIAADASSGDAIDTFLVTPLRSLLRFYRSSNASGFNARSPVLLSGEQHVPASAMERLAAAVDRPVTVLGAPPRVPAELRYATYLTCLGLLMRRQR